MKQRHKYFVAKLNIQSNSETSAHFHAKIKRPQICSIEIVCNLSDEIALLLFASIRSSSIHKFHLSILLLFIFCTLYWFHEKIKFFFNKNRIYSTCKLQAWNILNINNINFANLCVHKITKSKVNIFY